MASSRPVWATYSARPGVGGIHSVAEPLSQMVPYSFIYNQVVVPVTTRYPDDAGMKTTQSYLWEFIV